MTSPTRLTVQVTPAKQQLAHGHTAHITVTDLSAVPVQVSTRTVLLHSRCAESGTRAVHVHPAGFILAAGHQMTVAVTVSGPGADYGIVFDSSPLHHSGGIQAASGIGSQILTGSTTVSCVPPKAIHHDPPASFPIVPLALALVVAAGLVAAIWVTLRRRRRSTPVGF